MFLVILCLCVVDFCLKVMGTVNAQMNPQQVAQTMQAFERESAKMEMSEEMSEFFLRLSVYMCVSVCLSLS